MFGFSNNSMVGMHGSREGTGGIQSPHPPKSARHKTRQYIFKWAKTILADTFTFNDNFHQ